MAKAQGLTWTVLDADHMTQAEIYGEVLTQIGLKDRRVVALTADLAKSTKIGKFEEKIPERFFNVGIAEANMIAIAAGMTEAGLVPVVSTFATFASMRAAEFVRTDLCYQKRPVKIIATHSGTSFGQAGTTHHCTEDLAIMRSFAGMTVIAPADAYETARAVSACIDWPGPVYIRIGRGFEPPLHRSMDFDFEIGKAIPLRDGRDITVIATGVCVLHAVEAADRAAQNGVSVRVLDMHTLKPLDEEAVRQALLDTRRIITVEDHSVIGGLGDAVADVIARTGKGCAFRKLGYQDTFSKVGYYEDLLHDYGLDADGILDAIGQVLKAEFEADEDWEDEI
ncbi:MAG TPA: transketolase C-terminal domain-containing protein [Myxococcota bacterium]|nr:transketolase C-terminal domain-containing protein [Myxococcota bacterium]HQK49602.1 transketolase C-terminal domain-containing protein [Myxococcota bacterium]